jgi:hypothetical protein
MTVTTVFLNPQETGYAIILNDTEGRQFITVFTKKAVEKIIVPYLKQLNPNYTSNNNHEKDVKNMEKLMIQAGYKNRTPHLVEIVDALYDYKDSSDEPIIEMKKRYNLHIGGTQLIPFYPEFIPNPFPPLLSSPI